MVWRISKEALLGGWVVSATVHPELLAAAKEVASGSSWASSSFDLLQGADVAEDGPETIPAELYNELFGAPAAGHPTSPDSESKSPSKR